ncbi:unnamed protein product, partial [Dibothriocephalus latus]
MQRVRGGTAPDIESALPHSYGEEELQLQLALAISREEHEQEMRKRQEEEAKEALKLQMVLEQSKREEQNRAAAQETLVSTTPAATTNSAAAPGGSLFNLIDTSLSAAPANAPDPWTPVALPINPPPSSQPRNSHLPRQSQSFAVEDRSCVAAAPPPSAALSLLDDAWTPRIPALSHFPAPSIKTLDLRPAFILLRLQAGTFPSSFPLTITPSHLNRASLPPFLTFLYPPSLQHPPAQSVENDNNPWASLDPLLASGPTNGLHPSPLQNGNGLSATPAAALGGASGGGGATTSPAT